MTGPESITVFRAIIGDDKLDSTLEYQLANLAKTEVEDSRDWAILETVDETQSSSSSDTYNTGAKTLPTRYLHSTILTIGNDQFPYFEIPFNQRERYKNSARRWYKDMKNSQYYVAATNVSGTHHHFYIQGTADISSTQSWTFPDRYHMIIPIKMAKLFYPINTGEKIRAWDDRWAIQEKLLMDLMVRWNFRLQSAAAQNSRRGVDISTLPDAIDTNR